MTALCEQLVGNLIKGGGAEGFFRGLGESFGPIVILLSQVERDTLKEQNGPPGDPHSEDSLTSYLESSFLYVASDVHY